MKKTLPLNGSWRQNGCWFTRAFDIDDDFSTDCVYLEFDGLVAGSTVLMNGVEVGVASECQIDKFKVSDKIHIGLNELTVQCECESDSEKLCRDVRLVSYNKISIDNIIIEPEIVDNTANVWITIDVANHTFEEQKALASVVVAQGEASEKVEIAETITPFGGAIEAVIRITDPEMWQTDESGKPQLFDCLVGLQIEGEVMDASAVRFDVE